MGAKLQGKQEKDLFEQFQGTERKVAKKTRLLIPRIKDSIAISYENTVFLLIGSLMLCIICFTLGVEKGRRDLAQTRPIKRIAIAEIGTEQRPLGLTQDKEQVSKRQAVVVDKANTKTGAYVIQVAAFKDKEPAERALGKLRGEGYSADVRKSGEYYQLYVGGFNKKSDAERLKQKLQSSYADCYIKKL
ncbi:MAG: SPOR domain-containing protein [Candidatus Omnitrophota bacterium]